MQDLSDLSYYELLGVGADATPEEIVAAHRARVLRTHPDRVSDLQGFIGDHFDGLTALLNAARDTLLDPSRRARYDDDLRRRAGAPKGGAKPPPGAAAAGGEDRGAQSGAAPGAGARPGGEASDESEPEGERAARELRERMIRGEGGTAARLAYATPPLVQTAAMTVAASWLYSLAFFLLWQAGLSLAGFLLYLGLPLVCWRVRSRWGRKTARVSWPRVRRWPGFAAYNRRWLGRGLLEAGTFGAPVGLAGAFLPYAYPMLEAAGIAAAALGTLWFFAPLGRRSNRATQGSGRV